jgi:nitrogen fixation NifU-like protein
MSGRLILDHFRNPRNSGFIEQADGLGIEKENPWMIAIQVSLKVREGTIQEIKFKAQGCVTAIACASMMTETVRGQTVEKALSVSHQELSEALGTVPEEKLHCCRLAISALHKAIEDYLMAQVRDSVLVGSGN